MPREEQIQFRGIRNDLGDKFVNKQNYFDVQNFNQDDIIGANKIKAPIEVNKLEYERGKPIDGQAQFKYLDANNKLQTIDLVITGGKIYKGLEDSITTEIYSGLTEGAKVDFAILNDKLFIVNGSDYPLIYNGVNIWEMGAPEAVVLTDSGLITGQYYYAITYITAGGEEVVGTVSNTVNPSVEQVQLNIPIGYAGTTSRKIYRTEAGGSELKLLTTIADNTTSTYVDNNLDSALGVPIPETSNPIPKVKFIEVNNFKLIGIITENYPTQSWIGNTNDELWDFANFLDISNRSKDNSPLVGMELDYTFTIIASEKQIYILDTSGATPSVSLTRSNIGCADGYTMARMPATEGFGGGVMFLASDKTIRVFNGNFAQPVATSLDNLTTENWGQPIKKFLDVATKSTFNAYSIYFDFKYHLIINNIILVFDIRTQSWFKYNFANNITVTGYYEEAYFNPDAYAVGVSTLAKFNYMSIANNKLYIGRKDASLVEIMYSDIKYRGSDIKALLEFPYWLVGDELKYMRELRIYYKRSPDTDFDVKIEYGSITNSREVEIIDNKNNYFDENFYNSVYYKTGEATEDYKVMRLNKYAKWIKVTIISNENPLNFRGMSIKYDIISNKEIA